MKQLIFYLSFLCLMASMPAFSQTYVDGKPRELKNTREYVKAHYTKREVRIPMRDGVELFTAIYEPINRSVTRPIFMVRNCYGIGPYGEDNLDAITKRHLEVYVENEYILVFQDVRGKHMSGGEFEDIRPFIEGKKRYRQAAKNIGQTDEASDTYDSVEWLIHNTHNNGSVGVYGVSYKGFYAIMAALSGHPAIKAVSPQAPVIDWFHGDDWHHNGALMLADAVKFQPSFEYSHDNRRAIAAAEGHPLPDLQFPNLFHTDLYTDFLRLGTYSRICEAYGDSLHYLRTMREHPNWDSYWESHTVTKGHVHDVKPPIMVVGGLYDKENCYGAFDLYKSIKEQSPSTELSLVMGPWNHDAWTDGRPSYFWHLWVGEDAASEYFIRQIEYPFFSYYLEGKGEKPQQGALMYDTGTCNWISYPKGWPLVDQAAATPYYLHANGRVTLDPPTAEGSLSYVSDPARPVPYRPGPASRVSPFYMVEDQRFASTRPDVLVFQGDVLTDSLSLMGEIEVDLQVSLSTDDADFVVKVIDVFPDDFSYPIPNPEPDPEPYPMAGYQLMVRGEVMRGKFRESFSDPKPFEPGKTTRVRFTMPDVSHTFLPGHSLMIQVQSSWFPLVDRNPQTFCDIYTCDESAYRRATITLHCDPSTPSFVKLPVVKH